MAKYFGEKFLSDSRVSTNLKYHRHFLCRYHTTNTHIHTQSYKKSHILRKTGTGMFKSITEIFFFSCFIDKSQEIDWKGHLFKILMLILKIHRYLRKLENYSNFTLLVLRYFQSELIMKTP